jgi:hypothetical protein
MINLTGQKDGMEQIQTGTVNIFWKSRGIEADNLNLVLLILNFKSYYY